MNADSSETTGTLTLQALNTSIQVFAKHLEKIFDSALHIYTEVISLSSNYKSPIEFTRLQWTLFQVLLLLLLGTGVLIWCVWHKYGKVITDKFVRLSTVKEIEELKLSVAKLKLPKEHSPRI